MWKLEPMLTHFHNRHTRQARQKLAEALPILSLKKSLEELSLEREPLSILILSPTATLWCLKHYHVVQ